MACAALHLWAAPLQPPDRTLPLQQLLSNEHLQVLRSERSVIEETRVQLARLNAEDDDLTLLKRGLEQLDEVFLLVVVGEFNAGKTAFLNAMLGSKLLPEGVTPTTARIHVLRHGEAHRHDRVGDDYDIVYLPVEWLREVSLVDTPGTNAVVQRHQQITEHFVPQSDLVLFVTSADRPFSESERAFLERIRQWGKKVVIVVNKIDLIEAPADRETILDFVRTNAHNLLGIDPQIFPVSARLAQQARAAAGNGRAPSGPLWDASLFAPLEKYLLETLDTGERWRLKLENPLGVASRLLDKYIVLVSERQALLKSDFETLDTIDEQLAAYEQDMRRDFQYQFARVDNVLYAMAERGDKFFDETMRLTRIIDLMNGPKISAAFDRDVIGDTSRDLERHVNSLIDWMVDKDYRQWRAITEYLNRRWSQHADRIVGSLGADFEMNREQLLSSVGKEAQRLIDTYDRAAEADKLAQDVQSAIVNTAAIEVGALGLGAVLVAVLHTTLLDVTGVLGAGVLAAFGLYLLPRRRATLKSDLRARIATLRSTLETNLRSQFETELSAGVARIREAIAPYTRFVRVEREKLDRFQVDLAKSRTEVDTLRASVQRLE